MAKLDPIFRKIVWSAFAGLLSMNGYFISRLIDKVDSHTESLLQTSISLARLQQSLDDLKEIVENKTAINQGEKNGRFKSESSFKRGIRRGSFDFRSDRWILVPRGNEIHRM